MGLMEEMRSTVILMNQEVGADLIPLRCLLYILEEIVMVIATHVLQVRLGGWINRDMVTKTDICMCLSIIKTNRIRIAFVVPIGLVED